MVGQMRYGMGLRPYGYGYGSNWAAAASTTARYSPQAALPYGGWGYGAYGGASRYYGYGGLYGYYGHSNAETGHHPSYLSGPNCYYLGKGATAANNAISEVSVPPVSAPGGWSEPSRV